MIYMWRRTNSEVCFKYSQVLVTCPYNVLADNTKIIVHCHPFFFSSSSSPNVKSLVFNPEESWWIPIQILISGLYFVFQFLEGCLPKCIFWNLSHLISSATTTDVIVSLLLNLCNRMYWTMSEILGFWMNTS